MSHFVLNDDIILTLSDIRSLIDISAEFTPSKLSRLQLFIFCDKTRSKTSVCNSFLKWLYYASTASTSWEYFPQTITSLLSILRLPLSGQWYYIFYWAQREWNYARLISSVSLWTLGSSDALHNTNITTILTFWFWTANSAHHCNNLYGSHKIAFAYFGDPGKRILRVVFIVFVWQIRNIHFLCETFICWFDCIALKMYTFPPPP